MTPSQWRMLKSMSPYLCFAGGYGSGKSTALAMKVLQLVFINAGLPGILIGQTFGALENTVYAELWRIMRLSLPPELWPARKGGTMNPHLLFHNGSVVYLRSADNPGGYEGINAAWVCGDEIRYWPRKAYDVAISRARLKRAPLVQRCFASTPEMNWMADIWREKRAMHELITAGTAENAHNLEPNYIEGLRQSYSPRLQKAILEGHFVILEGAVYEQLPVDFWSSPWVVGNEDFNPEAWEGKTYLAVDPGYRRSAWLWIAEVGKAEWVVFDEMMPDNRSDQVCVDAVNSKPWHVDAIWCDPASDNTQGAFGLDTIDMLDAIVTRTEDPARYIQPPYTSISFGIDKIRCLLGDPQNSQPIRLKFHRRLKEYEDRKPRGIVKDMLSYRYPEVKDGRPVTDIPLKDGKVDHSNDAQRYWGVGMFLENSYLRRLDPRIDQMAQGKAGYKSAA